jgi:hypothetical protein
LIIFAIRHDAAVLRAMPHYAIFTPPCHSPCHLFSRPLMIATRCCHYAAAIAFAII